MLNICIVLLERIQALWIQKAQKSLTPILQHKINLSVPVLRKGIQVQFKSFWMMDQEQRWSRRALHTEEQLAAQEIYVFYTKFSMAMQTPSLCLVAINAAQNWGEQSVSQLQSPAPAFCLRQL